MIGITESIILLFMLGVFAGGVFLIYFVIKKAVKKGKVEAQKEIDAQNKKED